MTFPPCFANTSFNARINSGIRATNNVLPTNTLQRHHQQTQMYHTSVTLNYNSHISKMPTFEPRSATPDPLPLPEETTEDTSMQEDDSHQRSTNEERETEDNAARMLLELSQIVCKEISTDSGCIAWEGTTPIKKESKDLCSSGGVISNTNKILHSPSLSAAIPKSIEIRNRDCTGFQNASASRSTLEDNGIPQFVTLNSSFSSQQLPFTPNSPNSSFETYGPSSPSTERRRMNRYRTVSLVGDEMIPDNQELSPQLLPLSSPLLPKDFNSSFRLQESPERSRLLRHPLFMDRNGLEHESIFCRALAGGGYGAKALSNLLADSPAAAAAVITPIPEQPRTVLSFSNPFNKTSNGDPDSSNLNINESAIQKTNKEPKGSLPMDLPPLLFQSKKNQLTPWRELPIVSGIAARSYAKPTKRLASLAVKAAMTNQKAKKKNQPAPGSRAKKKAVPKKRQRHSGKKFSWKAFPELEEFLITNREEYLTYSAKNYTIEQRDYNNRLTSRLLEHAKDSGYSALFESCAFSAVRDRIRSYYKSYVQSFKRRRERQEQQERLKRLEMGCR